MKSLEALDALQDLAERDPLLAQQMAAEMQADVNAALVASDNETTAAICAIYDDMIFVLSPEFDLPEDDEPSQ